MESQRGRRWIREGIMSVRRSATLPNCGILVSPRSPPFQLGDSRVSLISASADKEKAVEVDRLFFTSHLRVLISNRGNHQHIRFQMRRGNTVDKFLDHLVLNCNP